MENHLNLDKHISTKYSVDLQELCQEALMMGSAVENQLKDALKSLLDGDKALAKDVIKRDKDTNKKELSIDQHCAKLLALRQPAASDLRLILAIVKSTTDLERIGDLSGHLARMSKKLADKDVEIKYYSDLLHLGEKAVSMLSSTLDAFARLDAEAAVETMALDKNINKEFDALSRQLVTYMMEDPHALKQTFKVFNAARALERVGDHCENICEYIIFLVHGEDVRYQSLDAVRVAVKENKTLNEIKEIASANEEDLDSYAEDE